MALPVLPNQGQDPWYDPRTAWDQAVTAEIEGRLSATSLSSAFSPRNGTVVRVRDFAPSSGDITAAVQTALNAMSPGDTLIFDRGDWRMDGTISLSKANTTVTLLPGSTVNRTSAPANITWLNSTASGFVLNGNGVILSPASWDGLNTAWTYAVVRCSGAAPTIRDVTLTNVNKVGLGFKDCNGTTLVEGVTINGNFPASQWTGIETVHFAITHDPSTVESRIIVADSTIRSSVQGIALGNFGIGQSYGSLVFGNTFEGCHNHGFYNAGGFDYTLLSLNSFVDCAQPIAQTGEGHVVSSNTLISVGMGANLNRTSNIHMRNAIGCIVANNRLKGGVFPSGPAIDFSHVSGGTVIRDNICTGNIVEVTGTSNAIGIRMGTSTTTDCQNNIVSNNLIRGGGIANFGAISLIASSASVGTGCKVLDNVVVVTGAWNGIYVDSHSSPDIRGNTVRFEYDSPSASVVGGVALTGTTSFARVKDNEILCSAAWGLNTTIRAIYELSGTIANRIGPNRYLLDPTKLTAGVIHVIQPTSGSILNEELPGVPTTVCGPGSMWRRTDGGAGSTLYIKETAANSGTWRAV